MDLVIGLMSGTSMDGVDAALLETDGEDAVRPRGFIFLPYEDREKETIRSALGAGDREAVRAAETVVTEAHIRAVRHLLAGTGARDARAIGFHGHTLDHRPEDRFTLQVGDAARLARETGLPVVADFRSADVAAGGQGAPLAPVYHRARLAGEQGPIAVLNIGGVANVTWIGRDGGMLAFDTGPGNALLDDWCRRHTGLPMDRDGRLAARGRVDNGILERLLDDPYFATPPPKSLDRLSFSSAPLEPLPPADGAATLTAFTAAAVVRAPLPEPPRRWIVSGGGRRNPVLMAALPGPAEPAEALGWNGDALEAEAFAYLAARRLKNLPASFPGTTGCPAPMAAGRLFPP